MKSLRSIPGARVLASYRVSWLRSDLVAGIVLTTLLVPQGMAYAELAGLPAITGLYTSILCLVGYAMFGPSRILVLGPDSSLGPMIAATILPIIGADGSPARAIALASMLALIVGAIMIGGRHRKARIRRRPALKTDADRLHERPRADDPRRTTPQALWLLDRRGRLDRRGPRVRARARQRPSCRRGRRGRSVQRCRDSRPGRWLPRVPAILVAVVAAIAATSVFNLAEHGVSLVGTLPKGFPPLTWPGPISDLPLLIAGALGIALVALTDTISTASSFAARTGQEIDGNGEMIGIGAANIAAGFFQGFPVSTSGSRTAVAEQSGAKTQLAGIVGAAAIILMLVLVPGLLRISRTPRWPPL